jgi:hypothetical protein
VTSSPRQDLAAALADAGPVGLTVFSEEPQTPPALPALVIRPGQPYRSTTPLNPYCLETWRLEVVALVPVDTVLPLDQLDALVLLTRDVVRAWPTARYNGVRLAPAVQTISGKSMHAAVVELDVDI